MSVGKIRKLDGLVSTHCTFFAPLLATQKKSWIKSFSPEVHRVRVQLDDEGHHRRQGSRLRRRQDLVQSSKWGHTKKYSLSQPGLYINYPELMLRRKIPGNVYAGNTKGGSIVGLLSSCLTGLDFSVLQIKTKIVSSHAADSKPVKQEVNSISIPWSMFHYHTTLSLSLSFSLVFHPYRDRLVTLFCQVVSFPLRDIIQPGYPSPWMMSFFVHII